MDRVFTGPGGLGHRRVGGLAPPDVEGFAALLSEQGYARSTRKEQLRLVAHLSRWLEQRGFEEGEVDEERIVEFLRYRSGRGLVARSNAAVLKLLLRHLRDTGVVREPVPTVDGSGRLAIERGYSEYLAQERGLCPVTLVNYLALVRRFLRKRFGRGRIDLKELRPAEISRFIIRYAESFSRSRAKLLVTALRSFLRFLHVRGEIGVDLASAVPAVANWRLSNLPKSITPSEVRRLLRGSNQRTVTGRRDYAILLLLARLGLRAGEVVSLTLEDLDWQAGEITVRGKGARYDRLPLPPDVGKALAAYLCHGRLPCSTRRVFIRTRAPRRGFANSVAVSTVVRRALERVGLDPVLKGAHLLRHTLATNMLRKGASLAEIGEILRHRQVQTTQIYAKVDLRALRTLAQPWPRGAL